MNTSSRLIALAVGSALAGGGFAAQAASFTYHGSLEDGGRPANGRYDLRLTLYGSADAAVPLANAVTLHDVEVRDGHFSTDVDFDADPPQDGWVAVAVSRAGGDDFTELAGRSPASGAGACWSTAGNAGTDPFADYLGTSDDVPLTIAVNGAEAAIFAPFDNGPSFATSYGTADAARATAVNFGTTHAVDAFAGGYSGRVPVGNDRSFVWGGTHRVPFVDAARPDQFDVWADGGFVVNSNVLPLNSDDFVIYPRGGPQDDPDVDLRLVTRNNFSALLYVDDPTGQLVIDSFGGVYIPHLLGSMDNLKVTGTATKTTAGGWQADSDGRIKQDVAPVEDALDTLAKVHPVSFRYTDAYRAEHPDVADQRYYNVIAQQFAEAFPDAVTTSDEYLPGAARTPDNRILQVDTYPAQIVTIAAVQELAQKNAALEATVKRLMARIARLEAAQGK
jgi:hypothetical protein